MSSPRLAAALLALLTLAAPRTVAAGEAAEPWGAAPLSGDPKAILAAARALTPPRGAPVDVLLEEGSFVFEESGAVTFTYRLLYRPLSREAARSWARIQRGWAPWHQARPEIRARVITPSGGVHLLDPRTLVEAALGDAGEELYSDRRVLQGPLPAVVADAIIEEVSVVRDVSPFFDAGTVSRFWFAQPNPVRLVRLRIDAPRSLPIRWVARGGDLRPVETEHDGRRLLLFERRDASPRPEIEPFPPRDAELAPHVVFTTGRSWEQVARRYAQVLDARLAGSDLSGIVGRVVPPGTPRPAAVRRITAWLHQNVRYTGLEFGEAAIVPAPPDETLGRRYGDCKDLSLLLVGLLRAAGMEAHVALLRTQWFEVSADLPGLGEFDHAIVRVGGEEPIWIDPTDPFMPPGHLPPPDEGRLALVARAGTRELVATPTSRSMENRSRTVREIFLAELGRGRIVETRELTGALAAAYRAASARATEEGQREALRRYATEVFRAERYVRGEVKGADEVGTPVDVIVEVDGSDVAQTDDDEAAFPVTPDPILSNLPDFLRGGGGEGAPPRNGEERAAPRKLELQLAEPYVAEMIYRIHPPLGFRARPTPADTAWSFGDARYEGRYVVEEDGSITATFRFDTGDRRLSPKEADGLAREVRAVIRSRSPMVSFERVGAALLAQGRAAEALAEMERLAALHPKEATHRLHLAIADFQLGLPEQGIAEARRAIALEPDRAWGWRVLGLGLQHDAVGRFRAPGFDRAGAIAAFRKARELDPSHAGGRAGLAGLLATGPDGQEATGPQLDEALAEWRSVREELGDHHYDGEYARALLLAGRFGEAAEVARDLEKGEARDALLLAAVAGAEGTTAAEAEARRMPLEQRRIALQRAAGQMLQLRRYPDASALASLAARGAPNAAELQAQADLLASARRWEELAGQGDEPTRLVRRLFAALVVERDPAAALEQLMAKRGRKDTGSSAAVNALRAGIRRGAARLGAPPAAVLDIALGRLEIVRDGEAPGLMRLRVRLPFAPGGRGSTIFLVRARSAWKVLATDESLPEVASEALRLAGAGDLASARRLLDWALDDLDGGTPGGPSPQDVMAALWKRNGTPPAADVRRAAGALAAWGEHPEAGITALERAAGETTEPVQRRAVEWALTVGYRRAERWEPLVRVADDLLAADPDSRSALTRKLQALQRLGRTADVERLLAEALAASPDDPVLLSLVASERLASGDLPGASRTYRQLIEGGKATPGDYNNAAWLLLWNEPVGETAIDWARRAVEGTSRRQYASLNTLAAVLAAAGRPAEAREVFLQALDAKETEQPGGADWVVQGMIAEKYGLLEAARAAYGRVVDGPEDDRDDPTRPSVYAKLRLARLPAVN